MAGRSVLYLGNGEQFDNVNGVPSRKWRGPGDIVEGISQLQSDKLCAFPEFEDVTELSKEPASLSARVAKAKADSDERRRNARRPETKDGKILEFASEADIEAELKRRREAREIQAAGSRVETSKPQLDVTSDKPEKPKDRVNLNELIDEAIGQLMNKPDALDASGIPTREAIEGVLGFPISEGEYNTALGGKAPSEGLDKTGFQQ